MEKKTRPGVMIYFDDVKPAMRSMNDEQFGALMRGVIEFSETGAVPELDAIGQIIFDMLRPKIERDADKYELTVWKRKYAVYVREIEKSGHKAESFDKWYEHMVSYDNTSYQNKSNDSTRYLTVTVTEKEKENVTGKGKVEGCKGGGKEEPDPQSMSRDEFMAILDQKHKERAECKHQQTIFDDEPDNEIPFD